MWYAQCVQMRSVPDDCSYFTMALLSFRANPAIRCFCCCLYVNYLWLVGWLFFKSLTLSSRSSCLFDALGLSSISRCCTLMKRFRAWTGTWSLRACSRLRRGTAPSSCGSRVPGNHHERFETTVSSTPSTVRTRNGELLHYHTKEGLRSIFTT